MQYFLKNISLSEIRVRSLGEKISVDAGEIFEVTKDEFENHISLYPQFFEQTFEKQKEIIEDDNETNLNNMTKSQLKEYAEKMGIALNDKKTKDEMLLDLAVELKKIEEMQTADSF